MKKTAKRLISLILSLMIIFGCVSTAIAADKVPADVAEPKAIDNPFEGMSFEEAATEIAMIPIAIPMLFYLAYIGFVTLFDSDATFGEYLGGVSLITMAAISESIKNGFKDLFTF